MSCISGVGVGVAPLLRLARSGRPIVALDGCTLRCTLACLSRAGVITQHTMVLTDAGARKRRHADYAEQDYITLLPRIRALCASAKTAQP